MMLDDVDEHSFTYLPLPPRRDRRRMAKSLGKAVERRMKDDAMFTAAERDFAELKEQLNEP